MNFGLDVCSQCYTLVKHIRKCGGCFVARYCSKGKLDCTSTDGSLLMPGSECMLKDWKVGPQRHKIICNDLRWSGQTSVAIQEQLPRPLNPNLNLNLGHDATLNPFKFWSLANAPNFALIAATCASYTQLSMAKFTTVIYVGRKLSTIGLRWHIVG